MIGAGVDAAYSSHSNQPVCKAKKEGNIILPRLAML